MGYLRGARRSLVIGSAVLAAAVVTVLFVVLPALATPPGVRIPPPSVQKGITPIDVPTGGQSDDCSVFYASAGTKPTYQYRISNPKSKTYSTTVNNVPVSFTLQMNPGDLGANTTPAYTNDKYVSVTKSTGAAIVDIGIKGGTDTARYNYAGLTVPGATNANYGSVSSDTYLHGPAQSTVSGTNLTPTSLYSVSNLTFCFELAGSVSGTIYQDNDQNGSFNSPGDAGLAGWTVDLRNHGTGSLVTSTTSGSDGSYGFSVPLTVGTTYRICESPPSGTWAQSQPAPSSDPGSKICVDSGELARGYTFTATSATQAVTGQDFGNVPAVTCSSPFDPFGDGSYLVKLAACKTNNFVFNHGTTSGGKPFVSLWADDQTKPKQPMVEKITWPYNVSGGQNQFKVLYTDAFPFDVNQLKAMQYCQLDPRDPSGADGLTLSSSPVDYTQDTNKGLVLPTGETSCLISTTESATGTFVAFVFSDIDGYRTTG
jgi:SdrD B-like protein